MFSLGENVKQLASDLKVGRPQFWHIGEERLLCLVIFGHMFGIESNT